MNAIQTEVSDGSLVSINVGLEYFEQSDISVFLDQSTSPLVDGTDYQWANATRIDFLAGPIANGITVTLVRNTQNEQMLNIYDGGAPFTRFTLDENFLQLLRLSQEFSEGLGLTGLRQALDMHGYRIFNLGDAQNPQDAMNLRRTQGMIEDAVAGVVGGTGWFVAEGAGAVNRTFQDKARDIVSCKDWVKYDGTDETAQVQAFVDACIALNKEPYWPDGTAVITGNIANFHQLRHRGPGRIQRSGYVFYMSPRSEQTNNLYIAPDGSDANDGLSPDFPKRTLAATSAALVNFGPYLDGFWFINAAAGTYMESNYTVPPGLRGRNPIYFKGPLSTHPAAPTAVFDGDGIGAFGMQLNRECTVYLMDLMFQNYASYGIVGQDGAMLFAIRCWVNNVPGGPGVKMQQGRVNWVDGASEACQMGFSFISGCTFTISSSSLLAHQGTRIQNNTQAGVQAQEQSSGHVDYALVSGNPVGYQCVARSRVHSQLSRVTGSVTAAVRLYGGSDWYNNMTQLDANATAELLYTGSIEVVHYQNNVTPSRRPLDSTFITHTGTTAVTVVKTFNDAFLANNFWNSTKSMRFIVAGNLAGTGGSKNITINVAGVGIIGFTIPAAQTGDFILDGTFTALAPTQQTYYATCMVNGQLPMVATGARGVAMNAGSVPTCNLQLTLVSAGDSISIRTVTLIET